MFYKQEKRSLGKSSGKTEKVLGKQKNLKEKKHLQSRLIPIVS